MELCRYLVDDFLIEYCRTLNPKDCTAKSENLGRKKQGKREYLIDILTRKLVKSLELLFQSNVDVPRIKHGKNQTIETLVNEEALLVAKLLRN